MSGEAGPSARRRRARLALPVLAATVIALAAAWRAAADAPARAGGGAFAWRWNLARVARLDLRGATPGDVRALERHAERWRAEFRGFTRELDVSVGDRSLPWRDGAARVVVGDADDAEVRELLARTGAPLVSEAGAVRFGELALDPASYAVAATLADPARPGLPVRVVAGSPAGRQAAAERLAPSFRAELAVLEGGERRLSVELAPSGAARPETLHVREAPLDASQEAAAAYERELVRALERASWGLAARGPEPTYTLRARRSIEQTPFSEPVHDTARFDAHTRELSVVLAPRLATDGGAALVAGLLEAHLGAPREPWMREGAAADAADRFGGASLDAWCAGLLRGGAESPAELAARTLEARGARLESALERIPLRGLLFRALRAEAGDTALAELWRAGLDDARARALESAFAARLTALAGDAEIAPADPLPAGWTGLELAAPLAPDPRGHGTRAALAEIERIAASGAKVALVTAHVVVPRGPAVELTSLEGHASLALTVAALREAGLAVVLSVQPLTSDAGLGPCDSPSLGNEALWREAIARHARGVAHGALLARASGASAVSVARGATPLFAVPWQGGGEETALHARIRAIKEEGWARIAAVAERSGLPLAAIAPDAGLAGGLPVAARLEWIGVDLEPPSLPERSLPDRSVPEGSAPRGSVPEETLPQESLPERSLSKSSPARWAVPLPDGPWRAAHIEARLAAVAGATGAAPAVAVLGFPAAAGDRGPWLSALAGLARGAGAGPGGLRGVLLRSWSLAGAGSADPRGEDLEDAPAEPLQRFFAGAR